MQAKRMAASVEPITVPVPPRIETPPMTEAVMTVSSRLGGTVDWMTCSCVANRSAAIPAKKPWSAKAMTQMRSGLDAGGARRFRDCRRPRRASGRVAEYRIHSAAMMVRIDHEIDRRGNAEDAPLGDHELRRHVGDPGAAGRADEAALEDRQHAERHDDRWNAHIGDEQALAGIDGDADEDGNEPGDPDRIAADRQACRRWWRGRRSASRPRHRYGRR